MCTCTYIPTKGGFLFAANRDEDPSRAGKEVVEKKADGTRWYVREPRLGGTNLCLNDKGRLVCLLNGSQNRAHPKGPFRKSRGWVVLDSFEYHTMEAFFKDYSFERINAFMLVALEKDKIFLLDWDGEKENSATVNPQNPYIWASPWLYTDYWYERRKAWLADFLIKKPGPTLDELFRFQSQGGDGNRENDMVMNRENKVCTVSISGMEYRNGICKILHKDLIQNTVTERIISC